MSLLTPRVLQKSLWQIFALLEHIFLRNLSLRNAIGDFMVKKKKTTNIYEGNMCITENRFSI